MNDRSAHEIRGERHRNFLDVITKLGGLATVGTALCTFYGYVLAKAYFTSLGAVWAIDLVGVQTFLVAAVPAITSFVGGAVITLVHRELSPRKGRIYLLGCFTMAVIVLTTFFFTVGRDIPFATWVGGITVNAYGGMIGIMVAHMSIRVADGTPIWEGPLTALVLLLACTLALTLPIAQGTLTARMHVDPAKSTLPKVTLSSDNDGSWRLVRALGDKALIVKLTVNEEQRIFRVVPIEQLSVAKSKDPS